MEFFLKTLLVSVPLAVLLGSLEILSMEGSRVPVDDLKALALRYFLAAPLAVFYGTAWINCGFDREPSSEREVAVLRRQSGSHDHYDAGRPWCLEVEAWNYKRRSETVCVSLSDYWAAGPGTCRRLEVSTKPGRLGYQWVSGSRLLR